MAVMSTYIITGKVKADAQETPFGTWTGVIAIPMFRVEADSRAAAAALAKEIIDPLETTEVTATAVEELPDSSTVSDRIDAELRALLNGGAVLTPYEHYCEAERLLTEAGTPAQRPGAILKAQVHATLATAIIPERNHDRS